MNPEELNEQTEHAHHSGQKAIGLTTAITAVLLAVATLLSHRAHTEEIKLQTQVNDQWSFYQAKHQRAHDYGKSAEEEWAAGRHELAVEFLKISLDEECGAPVEHNCTPPRLKQSPVLQQIMAEMKGVAESAHARDASDPAKEPASKKQEGTAEPAKPAKEGAVREGAVKVQERARDMEKETELISRRADHYDSSELFLEISIVLCSIALLAENKLYWKLSFITTAIGIAIACLGVVLR